MFGQWLDCKRCQHANGSIFGMGSSWYFRTELDVLVIENFINNTQHEFTDVSNLNVQQVILVYCYLDTDNIVR